MEPFRPCVPPSENAIIGNKNKKQSIRQPKISLVLFFYEVIKMIDLPETASITVKRTNTGDGFSYPILWEHSFDGLQKALRDIPDLHPSRVCIVTDSTVAELYLSEVLDALDGWASVLESFVFPAGEQSKNLDTVSDLYQVLVAKHFERKDLLVALGGGVTGDLAGFAAATYLRGIDFIQVPTTLLSQVDSSVGGKTGVDFQQYKNMVGAFHQPRLVYMNMSVLRTLPEEQFVSGMGEVIKTALIRDAELFRYLDENRVLVKARNPEAMIRVIRACCEVKAAVVEEDPTEKGIRGILNYGHTLGHAVEKCSGLALLHGQCVGIGMIGASWLSMRRGGISEGTYRKICEVCLSYGLPDSVSGLSPEEIVQASKSDKKMEGGKIKFILLHQIGDAFIDKNVSDRELLDAAAVLCR